MSNPGTWKGARRAGLANEQDGDTQSRDEVVAEQAYTERKKNGNSPLVRCQSSKVYQELVCTTTPAINYHICGETRRCLLACLLAGPACCWSLDWSLQGRPCLPPAPAAETLSPSAAAACACALSCPSSPRHSEAICDEAPRRAATRRDAEAMQRGLLVLFSRDLEHEARV